MSFSQAISDGTVGSTTLGLVYNPTSSPETVVTTGGLASVVINRTTYGASPVTLTLPAFTGLLFVGSVVSGGGVTATITSSATGLQWFAPASITATSAYSATVTGLGIVPLGDLQTIASFSAIPDQFTGTSYSVTPPVATSGFAVVLSVTSGPATISGNVLTFTGDGMVVLAANQSGGGGWGAATTVTTSVSVIASLVPVISTTTSIIDYPKGEIWIFQPSATNTPTSWTWTGLPPGITYNVTTGAIGGAATTRGFYVATVKATNDHGDSIISEMPISIYIGSWNILPSIDLSIAAATGIITTPASFSLIAKFDTDLIFDIVFVDSLGFGVLLNLADLRITVRNKLNSEVVLETDGTWISGGEVDARKQRIVFRVRGDALASMFVDGSETGPDFEGEIQLTHSVEINGVQYAIRQITPTFACIISPKLLP